MEISSTPATPAVSAPGAAGPQRIVSLVPSLTELVFDLGLGERLVGRTGFCVHPREALRAVPKVGGLIVLARLSAVLPPEAAGWRPLVAVLLTAVFFVAVSLLVAIPVFVVLLLTNAIDLFSPTATGV